MRSRKGWKRLAIALGVPYFGFWAFMLEANSIGYQRSLERALRAFEDGDSLGFQVNGSMASSNSDMINLAIIWGIVVPIAALIIWAIVRWVYRGFRASEA